MVIEKYEPGKGFLLADDYHNLHCKCPQCGGKDIGTTCMGPHGSNENGEYRVRYDHNHARCHICRWSGIVHDMVER